MATTEQIVARGNELHIRHISGYIVEVFEDILYEHGIIIPDDDRTGDEGEAPIYGCTYAEVEDSVTEILVQVVEDARASKPLSQEHIDAIYGVYETLMKQFGMEAVGDRSRIDAGITVWAESLRHIASIYPECQVNVWAY